MMKKTSRRTAPSRRSVIAKEYRDVDGYWIDLKPGWRSGQDPVGCLHGIVEDTKREAYSWLTSVLPCDCEDCKRELAITRSA
jgi:hypothetical protein